LLKYKQIEDFIADLDLIWSNCKLFNVIGSQIYRAATTMETLSSGLQRKFKLEQFRAVDEDAAMQDLLDDFDKQNPKKREESGDDSDEFGLFDPTKHVSFDEKIRFSEQIKKCSRERLTEIVNALRKEQANCVEDLGNDKFQLRIDNIELDAFIVCQQILEKPE
jgi:hypothetical protein